MSERPNILFLMTDQQRPDHVGWAPDAQVPTPHLERLAEGCVFERAYSPNPVCTPCRSALLTGKYTHQIGMLQMSGDLSRQHPTWPRALQEAGYWTAGIGKFHWLQGWPWGTPPGRGHRLAAMHEELGDYGFDLVWEASGKQLAQRNYCDWAARLDGKGQLQAYRAHVESRGPNAPRAEDCRCTGEAWPFATEDYVDIVTADRILQALDERPSDRPFALFGSFCSPHPPYDPPQDYLDRFPLEEVDDFLPGPDGPLSSATKQRLWRMRRAYQAMIACVDDQIGRILDRLEERGELDRTVIVFTSDHGEMLGDHGRVQKQSPREASVRVPTAIRHPDHLDGRRCQSPIELTDLTATILASAGLEPQAALGRAWPAFNDIVPGRSLLPVLAGKAEGVRDWAFSECANNWRMACDGRWKYVQWLGGDPELFDLATDPGEQRNLAAEQPDRCAQWQARIHALMDATPPAQTRWAPIDGDPVSVG